ncbi:MAG: hypothetical protein HYZ75_17260 [Elusimicrobia bacterium]|nr:hypothetical protein [Elusimicrobiota bacterium]
MNMSKIDENRDESGVEMTTPSMAMRKRWARQITNGTAKGVPVYMNGQWSVCLPRGSKRGVCVAVN